MSVSSRRILQRSNEIFRQMVLDHPDLIGNIRHELVFRVSKKMTRAAGQYSPERNEIILSHPFFSQRDNFDHELADVIAHELAHAISPPYRPRFKRRYRIHSPQWSDVNRALGGDGHVTHRMPLPDTREALCECCGRLIQLTQRQFNWWMDGEKIYCHKGQQFDD